VAVKPRNKKKQQNKTQFHSSSVSLNLYQHSSTPHRPPRKHTALPPRAMHEWSRRWLDETLPSSTVVSALVSLGPQAPGQAYCEWLFSGPLGRSSKRWKPALDGVQRVGAARVEADHRHRRLHVDRVDEPLEQGHL